MKMKSKKFVFLLISTGYIFALLQCSKGELSDDEYHHPITPLFDYSSVAFIARITENSSEWSLCTIDASGNDMRKIVDKTVACQKPVCSHFGTKILFTAVKFDYWTNEDNSWGMSSEYELCIVNTDGTGLTVIDRIAPSESGRFGAVAWSPDDSQIVYVRSYDNYWNKCYLILFNISDNTHTILQTEGNVCSPVFSPNGKQIAYCTTVETNDIVYVHSLNNHQIYKMDVDGNKNQLIIKNAASPKWSPRGDKIMYSISGKDGSSQISVANADGSNQKQLTSTVSPGWWDTGFPRDGNSDPQWTPDGSRIVYVSHDNEKPEIYIMNADGSKKTRLTKAEYWDGSPEITPDGEYILFHSRRSDMMESGICIMKLDGSGQKVLSKIGANPVVCRLQNAGVRTMKSGIER